MFWSCGCGVLRLRKGKWVGGGEGHKGKRQWQPRTRDGGSAELAGQGRRACNSPPWPRNFRWSESREFEIDRNTCHLMQLHLMSSKWSDRLPDPSRSRSNRSSGELLTKRPGSPLIASPIIDIPTYHPIQASSEYNALIIRVIDTFANRKANDSDRIT